MKVMLMRTVIRFFSSNSLKFLMTVYSLPFCDFAFTSKLQWKLDQLNRVKRPSQGFWGAGKKAYFIFRETSNYFKGAREQALNFRELGSTVKNVCLFVLEFYGPVNNEVMSSRSVALFLGRFRPSKLLTSTERGRPLS